MRIVVIDGQGGRLGREVVSAVRGAFPTAEIKVIGTNSVATATMLKAGASEGATGENPAIVACRRADYIIGPLGIVIADSLMGEVTPAMALAVAQSPAKRILIPMNMCDNLVAGVDRQPVSDLVSDVITKIREECDNVR
ncbi:MAG: DUF3842 family protein [Eubacterium sp.]|nr:DUF3842 family protein [Eubacterium sp.]